MNNSFKEGVDKFWKRFTKEESAIREMIDNKTEGKIIVDKINEALSEAFKNPYFELGKNEEGKYELILTPEGDRAALFPLEYWRQAAPEALKKTWNFYSSKPGKPDGSFSMTMYDTSIGKENISIYYSINTQNQKIDLEIYSPELLALEESQRYNMFFIFLDQFIGELYTMEYIGSIDFIEKPLNQTAIYIGDLKALIDKNIEENKWFPADSIIENWSNYDMQPSDAKDWQLREDIFVGCSACIPVLSAFYNQSDELFNRFEQDGIIYGFLFYKNVNIPQEQTVTFRSEIEDKILASTKNERIADTIGGATGFYFSYMDFVIYDKEAFMKIAKDVLSEYTYLGEIGFSNFIFGIEPEYLYR